MPVRELCNCLISDIVKKPSLTKQCEVNLEERIRFALEWLSFAQSSQPDGGVSLKFSLIKGWSPSYPETTGYIIPTFIDYYQKSGEKTYLDKALRMADWLMDIQHQDGSFKGGEVGENLDGFVFDTGQIIFGLLSAYKVTKNVEYLQCAKKAGDWLVEVQDDDGAWRKFAYHDIPHTYYARVAWAVAELWKVTQNENCYNCATKNIDWVLSHQEENGWFEHAGFTEATHSSPYTHTIAYVIRGVLETGICLEKEDYLNSAKLAGKALVGSIGRDGYCAGTYGKDWMPSSGYSCLTGNAQLAIIFFKLFRLFNDKCFFDTAKKLNNYLCQCQKTGESFPRNIRGGIAGSFPIWGKYMKFSYPNWATKFFIESLTVEQELRGD